MKNFFLALFLVLLTPLFFFTQSVFAQNPQASITLPQGQTINSDYMVGSGTVDVAGVVNGDAYVAGGNVTLDGTVNGDALVAGGSVVINGTIQGNLRVVGGNVVINGSIGKNVSTLGGSINLTKAAKVGGSIVGAGGTFDISSPIGKDIRLASGQLTIGSTVGGNVFAQTEMLSLTPDAKVAGAIQYWSNQKLSVASGAQVTGATTQHPLPQKNKEAENKFPLALLGGLFALSKLFSLVAAFLVGLLFIYFFPVYIKNLTTTVQEHVLLNMGVGIVAGIIVPIVLVLLVLTIIGIPIALLLGMLCAYSLYAAKIVVALVIGVWVLTYTTKKSHMVWALLVGLLIYELVSAIPFIGWLFSLLAMAAGLGAILIERRLSYLQLRSKKLI